MVLLPGEGWSLVTWTGSVGGLIRVCVADSLFVRGNVGNYCFGRRDNAVLAGQVMDTKLTIGCGIVFAIMLVGMNGYRELR